MKKGNYLDYLLNKLVVYDDLVYTKSGLRVVVYTNIKKDKTNEFNKRFRSLKLPIYVFYWYQGNDNRLHSTVFWGNDDFLNNTSLSYYKNILMKVRWMS